MCSRITLASAVVLAACGGDDDPGRFDENGCTIAPEVDDPGDTPRRANIDPTSFDAATTTTEDPLEPTLDDVAFPLGVQSGAVTDATAVLWTKHPPATAVGVKVWRDAGTAGQVAVAIDEQAAPDAAGFVHYAASGLAPSTEYRFAFFTVDGRSSEGRFITAFPETEMLRLRVGATSCTGSSNPTTRAELAPFPALSQLAAKDIDLTLHLGDISYNDGAVSVDDYRTAWSRTLSEQGYRDLLSSTSWIATWDDHEVEDNWDPEQIAEAQLANATQTYFEHVATGNPGNGRLWTSHQWGNTAEFIVTDLRSERLPSTIESADPQFVSPEQLDFIKERLRNSTAHFKVVYSSVNITNMPDPLWDVPLSLEDRWEGYRTQRQDLLQFIVDEGIDNVWFLAGDIHVGFIGRLEPDGPFSRMWEITVGPGGSGDNPLGVAWENDLNREDIFPCGQFIFGHGRTQVTTTIDFDAANDLIAVEYVDALTGETLYQGSLRQEPAEDFE